MKFLLAILLLFVTLTSQGTIFKCLDSAGTIHYQSEVCASDTEESIVKIRKAPKVDIIEKKQPLSDPNYDPYSKAIAKRNARKLEAQSQKAKCAPYLKQYAQLKKQVKNKCKQAKDIYCDLPGDRIEEKNYSRDKSFANRDGPDIRISGVSVYNSRAMSGKLGKPPLLRLKQQLREMKCL